MNKPASAIMRSVMDTRPQSSTFAEATGSAFGALLLGLLLTQAG
jgi:hypothetical protein